MSKHNEISIYILAGGKSSRMGTDKGLLVLNEKCLIEYVIAVAKKISNNIYIVTVNEAYKKFSLQLLPDVVNNIGPAGGIYTALTHCQSPKCIVLSCDMPFISKEAIEFLLEESAEYDITVPVYKTKLEPMMGIYAANCLLKWKTLIEQKCFKLQDLFANFNTQLIEVDKNLLFNETIFMNVNSPEDKLLALNYLKHGH